MNGPAAPATFDLAGPLPEGITLLEASAGTGKTYAIAGLAARYVAEGVPLERVLLVTFTRIATSELRERVRERLVSVERALRAVLAGAPPSSDRVVEHLARGSRAEVSERRERLERALADFDAATIVTTHGFCQEVLSGLGIAGDLEGDVTFVEDLSDLVEEVVDDLYVRVALGTGETPFPRAQALAIAHLAVNNPTAPIAEATDPLAARRRRLAISVRRELEIRKRQRGVMGYDDLLTRLRDALAGRDGATVAARLRERYTVVLVDEFQDTDPVQWDIMRRAFGDSDALVLIADPKQAIYAFRGADVYAYLDAARAAATQQTLGVNWRSDQTLLDGFDALFGNAQLGEAGIGYRRVRADGGRTAPQLWRTPVRFRVIDRSALTLTPKGFAQLASAREAVAEDVAADLVSLFNSGARVPAEPGSDCPAGLVEVCPAHVAVLVRINRHATMVRDSLEAAGIPAVIGGSGSVFATDTAVDWLRLLEALERPGSLGRAHSAALTPFIGWSPEQVALAAEPAWEGVHRRLHEWARVLQTRGVASLLETVTRQESLPGRLLAREDGERELTDLRHVGQLLHVASSTDDLGTAALTGWLRRRIAEADGDAGDEDRSRRLDSDADAVQVLTIHRSKGLEFPIVYVPYLWDTVYRRPGEPVAFHDRQAGHERTLDVSLKGAGYHAHSRQSLIEDRGEDLRLAYVAVTRARHQVVIWWAGTKDCCNSPLGRLMFARAQDGTIPPEGPPTPADAVALQRLEAVASEAPHAVDVDRVLPGLPAQWSPPLPIPADLAAARFGRTLDRRWRRTSYSAITAASHEALVASEPEDAGVLDEPEEPAVTGTAAPSLGTPSPLGAMGIGAAVGTAVHRTLEMTDFAAEHLEQELGDALEVALTGRAVEIGDRAAVAAGLRSAIETPLGTAFGGLRLRDVARPDRLDELAFELPLAGGDRPHGAVDLAAVARLLRVHLPADDPLAGYAERLNELGGVPEIRGYLTGSLDLVIRIPAPGGARFAIADYKTNWLGDAAQPLLVENYALPSLRVEMERRHYGLQALFYLVALHRYLRWRVSGYDPDRHLAGVAYLFVRGMAGAGTPSTDGRPAGVFAWQPPGALVRALSDALDAQPAAASVLAEALP